MTEQSLSLDAAAASVFLGAVAGHPMQVLQTSKDGEAWVDGDRAAIDDSCDRRRLRELMVVQGLLARIGSTDPGVVSSLRGRRDHLDRFIVLEVARGLREHPWLAAHVTLPSDSVPVTANSTESLALARSGAPVPDKPLTWGTIKRQRRSTRGTEVLALDRQIQKALAEEIAPESEAPERNESSFFLKLMSLPMGGSLLGRILRSGSAGDSSASGSGGPGAGASRRATDLAGAGRTVNTPGVAPALLASDELGGAWYPEWDDRAKVYRPDWCQVHSRSTSLAGSISDAFISNQRLRRTLAQFALGMGSRRRAVSGDRLDLPAVVQSRVEARAGHANENICIATERARYDLGVLVLLDCSGSSTEKTTSGRPVHDVQCEVTAQLVQAWSDIGVRVACFGFHSRGRTTVHVYPVKSFDDRWGVGAVSALRSLRPGAYTRLGAAIRHGASLLTAHAGTDRLLLVVVSDCHPYDEDYEGTYAEADVRRSLEEAQAQNIRVLVVSTLSEHERARSPRLVPVETIAFAGNELAFPASFRGAMSHALSREPGPGTPVRRLVS